MKKRSSEFSASVPKTMSDLQKSLDHMNGVLAGIRKLDDGSGAEIKISINGNMYGWKCETYKTYRENLRAIERFIAHMFWDWHKHKVIKLGGEEMIFSEVMSGFQITDGSEREHVPIQGRAPWEVLGIRANASTAEIQAAYRGLIKIYHPDTPKTGNKELFKEIVDAQEAMLSGQ